MAGTVTISGNITGTPSGTVTLGPFSLITTSANQFAIVSVTLAATAFTSVTVPTWASGVVINPATSNTIPITLKGVTGDTGIALSLSEPTLLNFPATPPGTFGLTTTGTPTTITQFLFF